MILALLKSHCAVSPSLATLEAVKQLGGRIAMGDIVNFPTKSVRDWLIIERAMNEAFSRDRVSSSVQTRLVERMKSFYKLLELDFNFTINAKFPSVISQDQINAICSEIGENIGAVGSEKLQAFTHKLFFDRLEVEMDLCRALHLT
jgi:hypothetical protein